jgi:hypothetical protein
MSTRIITNNTGLVSFALSLAIFIHLLFYLGKRELPSRDNS